MANVKVAVRVRPLSKREEESGAVSVVNVHNDTLLSITNWKIGGTDEGDRHRERVKYFSFDYVFNSSDKWDENYISQEQVYLKLGPEVINAACDGYNTCLFAYGQTSSGKTYTMVGDEGDPGLIPRISKGLFNTVAHLEEDVTYKFEISFMEIYNEKVRDLLAPVGSEGFALKVREHSKDGPYVPDLTKHIVSDHGQMIELLQQGMVTRTTASTHMHECSSRSHAIFTIHFVQAKMEQQLPSEIVSKINLVDLAGSERANLNFSKDRLQEGANINKSLVMLGNCISALGGYPCDFAENALAAISMESLASEEADMQSSQGFKRRSTGFVPYRNSVLTWLLKDSLGGNAKTVMVATVSPASVHYNETMSTLRYARRATHIVNQPVINEDPHVRVIRELRGEILRLKNLLCSVSLGSSSASLCQDHSINQMLQENEVKVDQLTEAWVDKWKDVAQIMQECNVGIRRESVGVVVESDVPHLIGLNDDLGTGIILYHLQDGCTRIGREDACTTQDIVLNSSDDVEKEHAIIMNENDVVTLYPMSDALCTVNGVDVNEPVQLKQGAVILLGKTNMFRFNHPAEAARLREKRATGKIKVAFATQHGITALAAANRGEGTSLESTPEGTLDQEDRDAMLEQMSLLLAQRSSNGTKDVDNDEETVDCTGYDDSCDSDTGGEEELNMAEANQEELLERQRRVVFGLKTEHALSMASAEKELQEMIEKLKLDKEEATIMLQREQKEMGPDMDQSADFQTVLRFVDLQSTICQAVISQKHVMQKELVLQYSVRKAEANIERKRAAVDVQRMSTELEIEEEEKRLQEIEILVSYSPPIERISSTSSETSSVSLDEQKQQRSQKSLNLNRNTQSLPDIQKGVNSKGARRKSISDSHKRSSSLSQNGTAKNALPNRARSHSLSASIDRASAIGNGRKSENRKSKYQGKADDSNVFSRLYPQKKPKFDYLKKKDPVQYEDKQASRKRQWERGQLMRKEVSPSQATIPPGKSSSERLNLKHSYQPNKYDNGLSVNPKNSQNGTMKHSGLSSALPRTKSSVKPPVSRKTPAAQSNRDGPPPKENVSRKPKSKTKSDSRSRSNSSPDVSAVKLQAGKKPVKEKSNLIRKVLKKGEKKEPVWQKDKNELPNGSPSKLNSSIATPSSKFPKIVSERRRFSTGIFTSLEAFPIQKQASEAYFVPWNPEKSVSLEDLSQSPNGDIKVRGRSLSMVELPNRTEADLNRHVQVDCGDATIVDEVFNTAETLKHVEGTPSASLPVATADPCTVEAQDPSMVPTVTKVSLSELSDDSMEGDSLDGDDEVGLTPSFKLVEEDQESDVKPPTSPIESQLKCDESDMLSQDEDPNEDSNILSELTCPVCGETTDKSLRTKDCHFGEAGENVSHPCNCKQLSIEDERTDNSTDNEKNARSCTNSHDNVRNPTFPENEHNLQEHFNDVPSSIFEVEYVNEKVTDGDPVKSREEDVECVGSSSGDHSSDEGSSSSETEDDSPLEENHVSNLKGSITCKEQLNPDKELDQCNVNNLDPITEVSNENNVEEGLDPSSEGEISESGSTSTDDGAHGDDTWQNGDYENKLDQQDTGKMDAEDGNDDDDSKKEKDATVDSEPLQIGNISPSSQANVKMLDVHNNEEHENGFERGNNDDGDRNSEGENGVGALEPCTRSPEKNKVSSPLQLNGEQIKNTSENHIKDLEEDDAVCEPSSENEYSQEKKMQEKGSDGYPEKSSATVSPSLSDETLAIPTDQQIQNEDEHFEHGDGREDTGPMTEGSQPSHPGNNDAMFFTPLCEEPLPDAIFVVSDDALVEVPDEHHHEDTADVLLNGFASKCDSEISSRNEAVGRSAEKESQTTSLDEVLLTDANGDLGNEDAKSSCILVPTNGAFIPLDQLNKTKENVDIVDDCQCVGNGIGDSANIKDNHIPSTVVSIGCQTLGLDSDSIGLECNGASIDGINGLSDSVPQTNSFFETKGTCTTDLNTTKISNGELPLSKKVQYANKVNEVSCQTYPINGVHVHLKPGSLGCLIDNCEFDKQSDKIPVEMAEAASQTEENLLLGTTVSKLNEQCSAEIFLVKGMLNIAQDVSMGGLPLISEPDTSCSRDDGDNLVAPNDANGGIVSKLTFFPKVSFPIPESGKQESLPTSDLHEEDQSSESLEVSSSFSSSFSDHSSSCPSDHETSLPTESSCVPAVYLTNTPTSACDSIDNYSKGCDTFISQVANENYSLPPANEMEDISMEGISKDSFSPSESDVGSIHSLTHSVQGEDEELEAMEDICSPKDLIGQKGGPSESESDASDESLHSLTYSPDEDQFRKGGSDVEIVTEEEIANGNIDGNSLKDRSLPDDGHNCQPENVSSGEIQSEHDPLPVLYLERKIVKVELQTVESCIFSRFIEEEQEEEIDPDEKVSKCDIPSIKISSTEGLPKDEDDGMCNYEGASAPCRTMGITQGKPEISILPGEHTSSNDYDGIVPKSRITPRPCIEVTSDFDESNPQEDFLTSDSLCVPDIRSSASSKADDENDDSNVQSESHNLAASDEDAILEEVNPKDVIWVVSNETLLSEDYTDENSDSSDGDDVDDIDIVSFKRTLCSVGIMFNHGKRHVLDSEEIFDPFALTPIEEEKDLPELASSPVSSGHMVPSYDPLLEEKGDVALYQRQLQEEEEDSCVDSDMFSDESDEDGNNDYDELTLNDLSVSEFPSSCDSDWSPLRVEVALIKDVITAEKDLPSDLVKSPDAEEFLFEGHVNPLRSTKSHDTALSSGKIKKATFSYKPSPIARQPGKSLQPIAVIATHSKRGSGRGGFSPKANFRTSPLEISFTPPEVCFSTASPCSSPESPERKLSVDAPSKDTSSDCDDDDYISEGETTPNIRSWSKQPRQMSRILEYDENDSGGKAGMVTNSRIKFSKFIQKEEDSDTSVIDQTYYRDQETIKEKDVLTNSFLQTSDSTEGYTADAATVERRWPTLKLDVGAPGYSLKHKKQLSTKRLTKGETGEGHFSSLLALATDQPPEVKNGKASGKPFVTSSTQTSPQASHSCVHRLPGRTLSENTPKTHDTHSSIGTQYESHSTASTPSGDFRWELFPSVTDFQPTSFRRSVSLPEFDNPLLVSPRKCSVETTLSEGEDARLGSSPNVWDVPITVADSKCPQVQRTGSVQEPFARNGCGAPPSGLTFQDEDGNIEQCETQKTKHAHHQGENIKQAITVPALVEGSVLQESVSVEPLDGRLCARCNECLSQDKSQSGKESATIPADLKPFVWEPVTKQKMTLPRQEELYHKISSLQDGCLMEDDPTPPYATGGGTRPSITVIHTTDRSAQTSSDDLIVPISEHASPDANRRISQDTQELAPQRIQMPAFSDVSFDSEFADQDFLSDEELEEEEDDLEADVKEIEVKVEGVLDHSPQVEFGEEGESTETDPELLNDKMEPELTALMSDHSASPLDKSTAMESKTLGSKIPSVEQNSSVGTGQVGRVNVLGTPGNFSTALPAHRTKDHSSDYVLSVNINIPPFPNRVEQHWNSPQYTPSIPQHSWPDIPGTEDAASMSQQHSEIGEQHIPVERWIGGQRPQNTVADKMPQRFPSESTESHLTSSSGVFTSSIQTSERVSSPNRSNESQSPVDSALSDTDIDSVRNEFEEFLSKNAKLDPASPMFSDNEDRGAWNPDGVGTQVDWMDVNRSWISPDLESLRDERETVRRLSNSWDRSDIAVELMEARIMHGIGETDAFLRFLDSEIPEEEWLQTKNNLDLQHAEEKRDILALEKNSTQAENEDRLHSKEVTLHSGTVPSSGLSPKRRKPPSEHLKFLQGLRKDLIGSNPPSFFKEKNEIEALLEEYKELHRSSESEIAQAQRELNGARDKPVESPLSGPSVESHIGHEEDTEKDLIDREIKSLHAASLAMSLSNSPGSDIESQHQFDFSSFSSDDERTLVEDRGKYYRLRSDLSDPLVLVKTPTKQTLQEKLREAERQVSSQQLTRRRSSLEKDRQPSAHLAGEWSDSECSVLIGQTFQVLLQESAIIHQLQHHSDSESHKKGEWKFLFTKRDTFTYEKDHQEYFCKWYSGKGIIKAPASCIFNLIHKPSNFYAVFGKYLKKITVLQKFDDGKSIIRINLDTRKCGLDQSRSVTCVLHAKRVRNKYVIGSTSVIQPSPLQVPGTVSANVTCFGFCLEPLFDEDGIEQCLVTVIFHIDLKSHLDEDLLQVIFQKLPSTLLCNIRGQVEVGHL